jgi:hypothetical protein
MLLWLLHAGDAMVLRIIHSDFAIAGIDGKALLIAKKCVARFVLTAGLSWAVRRVLRATSVLALSWAPSASSVIWVSSQTLVP